MSRPIPLLSEESAGYLARILNRAAASFDVTALSPEEAIEAYMLLDRLTSALWREHSQVLVPLYQSLLERLGVPQDEEDEDEEEDDDDEPEGSGSTSQ